MITNRTAAAVYVYQYIRGIRVYILSLWSMLEQHLIFGLMKIMVNLCISYTRNGHKMKLLHAVSLMKKTTWKSVREPCFKHSIWLQSTKLVRVKIIFKQVNTNFVLQSGFVFFSLSTFSVLKNLLFCKKHDSNTTNEHCSIDERIQDQTRKKTYTSCFPSKFQLKSVFICADRRILQWNTYQFSRFWLSLYYIWFTQ